jgi:hypothetical protein
MTTISTDQINIQLEVPTQQTKVSENLQIKTTQVLPTLAPNLKVGDLIQFLVKEVRANNTGLLYYFGQLIEAKLPQELKSGDIVKAEVQRQNESVILKIKEILEKAHSPLESNGLIIEADSNIQEILSHKVEFLLKSLDSILRKVNESPTSHEPTEVLLPFPEIKPELKTYESLRRILDTLKNILPKENELTISHNINSAINKIHDGSILSNLDKAIETLNLELLNLDIGHEAKFSNELIKKLTSIQNLSKGEVTPEKIDLELKKLITILGREIGTEEFSPTTLTPQKLNFKISLQQLKLSLEKIITQEKTEEKSSSIDNLLKQVENKLGVQLSPETKTKEEILNTTKGVLQALETIVQSQEMLNRLEPILNALKEPQLLLFPFLFSGMLGFGEFMIDPDSNNKQNKKNTQDKKNKEEAQIHSYQGVIPLPSLGQVQFNATQSESEIDLIFTVEGEEKKIFLEGELKDLRDELLKKGLTCKSINISTALIRPPTLEGLELHDSPIVIL